MISVQLAPLEITIPVYFAVRYNGATQLRLNSIFYIFNFVNIIFAINSNTNRGV